MSIWKQTFDIAMLNQWERHCMIGHLGIVFSDFGEDYLSATMPVDHRTQQPYGIMHGGASCVLAETVGSTAGLLCLDVTKEYCVGLSIETHHLKSVRNGLVTGTARPIHLGRTTQLWDILITNEADQTVSSNRLTVIIRDRERDNMSLHLPEK